AAVAKRTGDGDYRGGNRGGVGLMDANPGGKEAGYGLPKGQALYGSLPRQLKDPPSFASRLKRVPAAPQEDRGPEGEVLAGPEVKNPSVCLLVLKLPGKEGWAITALNFGRSPVEEQANVAEILGIPPEKVGRAKAVDILAGKQSGQVNDTGRLTIQLGALEA